MYSSIVNSKNLCDGYELLANAVIIQAAKEYREALCKRDDVEAANLERFFAGEHIKLYTKVDGKMLIDKLKQQVEECNYDLNKVREMDRQIRKEVEASFG